jgi:hypothetical protein
MAHNFYAVKRGFDKEKNQEVHDIIESDWYKVKPLVIKYENSRYKGFDTEEEAKAWLSVVDKTDAEKRAKKTLDKAKEDIGITNNNDVNPIFETIVQSFKDQGYSRSEALYKCIAGVVNAFDKTYDKTN